MSDTIDTITLDGGKYTVELGHKNGRFSFTALRHGQPWGDMSSDGDNLMLAMFQELRNQQEQIARLEKAAREPVQRTIQRWDVRDGSTPALEAEPTYTLTMDPDKGLVEIRPAGIADDDLDGLPQLTVAVEVSGGVPRAYIYNDVLDGEVLAEHIALPEGNLVGHLNVEPDVNSIGELLRSRGRRIPVPRLFRVRPGAPRLIAVFPSATRHHKSRSPRSESIMTTTTPTLRFGFAPRAAAPAAAPVATAPVGQPTTTSTPPVQEAAVVAQAAQGVAAAAGEASQAPAIATEDITIMLPIGGRQGQVFGGVFGRMEGDKFRTDPLLKSIYLLELIDGAVPGCGRDDERGEMLEQMGGIPETVTISVPSDLAASFKATLANLSGARWQQLYEQAGAGVNSMVKFALNNEARVARETVAQIARTGGEVFTVQVAEPKELRFMMVDGDDYDDYDRELSGVPQAVAGSPVVTAVAGEVADAAVGQETLASACGGRQEGDTLSYTHIELFTVVADSAENAVKVQALVPAQLMNRTAMSASDVMVNGQPYVLAAPLLEDESSTADVPR